MNTKLLEARTVCLFEPEEDEFVQVDYLCGMDAELSEDDIISLCGGTIKDVGFANDKKFMQIGMYPIYLIYERGGSLIREKQNPINGIFKKNEGGFNVYEPVGEGVTLTSRMHYLHNKKKKAA